MKKRIKLIVKKNKNNFKFFFSYLIDRLISISTKKTIIINGFWRSGTTLLQTKLCASLKSKSIFEPFGPDVSNSVIYSNSKLDKSKLTRNYHNAFFPYSAVEAINKEFNYFLRDCFTARIKAPVTRRLRKSIITSFRKTVACKFVRGHLLLPYLLENNKRTPIIHISRNPKAVIASILRKGWGYWFNDFLLVDHLINIDDGRISYFKKYKDLIDKYDKLDTESRICALWCLTEKYVQDNCSNQPNFLSVKYEDLIKDGFKPVKEFLKAFNYRWYENNIENFSSATTNQHRINLSMEEKRDSWKTELNIETQEKINSILLDFGM